MTQPDHAERDTVAQALQNHMEQHHGIRLNRSDWVRAADVALAAVWSAAVFEEWHDKNVPAPEGVPVLAEYHEWNLATNPPKQQVVWCVGREWHRYPATDDLAYVKRWKYLPTTSVGSGFKV